MTRLAPYPFLSMAAALALSCSDPAGPPEAATDAPILPDPIVVGIAPERGFPGERVIIRGEKFLASQGRLVVTFKGVPASIAAATDSTITVLVPSMPPGYAIVFVARIQDGRERSDFTFFTVLRRGEIPDPGAQRSPDPASTRPRR